MSRAGDKVEVYISRERKMRSGEQRRKDPSSGEKGGKLKCSTADALRCHIHLSSSREQKRRSSCGRSAARQCADLLLESASRGSVYSAERSSPAPAAARTETGPQSNEEFRQRRRLCEELNCCSDHQPQFNQRLRAEGMETMEPIEKRSGFVLRFSPGFNKKAASS